MQQPSSARYRTAWLVVSGIGFLLSLLLLGRFIVSKSGKASSAETVAAAPAAPSANPSGPLALRARPVDDETPAPAPEPVVAEEERKPEAPSSAPSMLGGVPADRGARAPVAKKTAKKKPASRPAAPAKPLNRGSVALEDGDAPQAAAPPPPSAAPPAARAPGASAAPGTIGLGTVGTIGHGEVARGPQGPAPDTKDRDRDDDGAAAERELKAKRKESSGKRRNGGKGRAPAASEGDEVKVAGNSGGTGRVPGRGRDVGELLPGHFSYSIPPKMMVGQVEHITCSAGLSKLRALIDQELVASSPSEMTQSVKTADIPLSRLLRVELKPDNEGDFEIRSFVPSEQYLSEDGATIWKWAVTPRSEGDHNLTVVITNLSDASGKPIRVKLYGQRVVVESSFMYKAKGVFVAFSGALSGLAGVVGAWMGVLRPMLMRRREEGEYGGGRGRGGGFGGGGGGGGGSGGGGGAGPQGGGGTAVANAGTGSAGPQGGGTGGGAPGGGTAAS